MRNTALFALLGLALVVAPQTAAAQDGGGLELEAAEWISLLKAERFDSAGARVATFAQASMDASQLAMIWPQIVENFGELEKTEPINQIQQGEYTVVQLLGTFAKGTRTIRVAFDKEGRVAGFVVVDPPSGGPPGPRH